MGHEFLSEVFESLYSVLDCHPSPGRRTFEIQGPHNNPNEKNYLQNAHLFMIYMGITPKSQKNFLNDFFSSKIDKSS